MLDPERVERIPCPPIAQLPKLAPAPAAHGAARLTRLGQTPTAGEPKACGRRILLLLGQSVIWNSVFRLNNTATIVVEKLVVG